MSKQDLAINFNVVDEPSLREELIKAQAYINALNAQIEALSTVQEELKKRLDASPY
jgi:hypothetical protein